MMPLTPAQLTTLKNDIAADGALNPLPNNDESNFTIRDAYNAAASPAFVVWRSNVPVDEMTNVFVWTAIDALSVGKARIWDWMSRAGVIDASNSNVRQGFVDAFGGRSATVTAVTPVMKRNATRAEKLFATGTGSSGSPGTMGFEGQVTAADISAARNT